MTREQKTEKRKLRAQRRREKRAKEKDMIIQSVYFDGVPISAARSIVKHGYPKPWRDSNSPTGMSQKCDWAGTCQYPCNGDC